MTDGTSTQHIDRERMLALTKRLPDDAARSELFETGQPLVRGLAGRFMGRGEPLDDLIQVASMGYLKAIDNFDAKRGDSLLAYATAVIIGELRHYFRDSVRPMRIPRRLVEARRFIDQCVEELTQQYGRSPTVSEIVKSTGFDEETVLEAIATLGASWPIPIDELSDTTADKAVTVVADYSRFDDLDSVSVHLAGLPARERRVLFLRFYREYSQAEVAEEIGISQVQVSRILSSSLRRIRREVDTH